jgi:hypothetical protein
MFDHSAPKTRDCEGIEVEHLSEGKTHVDQGNLV